MCIRDRFGAYGKGDFENVISNYNKKLYIDPVTEAYNRQYYEEPVSYTHLDVYKRQGRSLPF